MGREPGTRSPGSGAAGGTGAFRLDIQGLRGIAVLLVVLYHADLLVGGGFIGVDVFFVISGYVVTLVLLRELAATGTISLRDFYARRVRRLLPALATVMIVTIPLVALTMSPAGPQRWAAATAAAASLFSANLFLAAKGGGYFDPAESTNPFLHTWSLSVEEQFYLLLPLTALVLWRLGSSRRSATPRRALAVGIAAASLLSLLANLAATHGVGMGEQQRFAFYLPVTRAWEFGVGVLLAVVAPRLVGLGRRTATVVGAAGLAAVLGAGFLYDDGTVFPGVAALLPVLGTGALLVAGPGSPAVGAVLGWRPLVEMGNVSYGWYLWHWPAIVLAATIWPDRPEVVAVAAFASLAPAWISYHRIENPVRRQEAYRGWRAVSLAAVLVTVPLLAAGALGMGAITYWGGVLPEDEVAVAQRRTLASRDGCGVPFTHVEGCTYPAPPGADAEVVLVGDSHAATSADAVQSAAARQDLAFSTWVRGACSFLDLGPTDPACESWRERALVWALDRQPDVLVVVSYDSVRLRADDDDPATGDEGPLDTYRAALEGLLDRLDGTDTRLVVLATVPDYDRDPFEELSLLRPELTPATRQLVDVRAERRGMLEVLDSLAEDHPRLRVVDPVPLLCSTDECSQREGADWLYRDRHHLSLVGAERLTDAFADAFGSPATPPPGGELPTA